jgi:hypothetical protein
VRRGFDFLRIDCPIPRGYFESAALSDWVLASRELLPAEVSPS